MQKFTIPYGKNSLEISVPDDVDVRCCFPIPSRLSMM